MNDMKEKEILELLSDKDFIKIDEIAKTLSTSPSTVRRKLADLQSRGLVQRFRGGAQLNDEKNYFPKFSFRSHMNSFEKKKIALAAIKLIKNGDVIFLDGSTSAFFIAEYLAEFNNIKVFTNGIDTLSLLAKYNINAYSTGGQVSTENPSVLIGHYADDMLKTIRADLAFFSCQSISKDGEIYDCFLEENALRKTMIRNARKSVFLCDSTKFGKTAPFRLCSINDVDYMVSDCTAENYFDSPVKTNLLCLN